VPLDIDAVAAANDDDDDDERFAAIDGRAVGLGSFNNVDEQYEHRRMFDSP